VWKKYHVIRQLSDLENLLQCVRIRFAGNLAKRPALQADEPFSVRSDPEAPFPVSEKRKDIARTESGRVAGRENVEANSIEPDEAVERAHPQVTVPGLGDASDRDLGKAILCLPGVHEKLGRGVARQGRNHRNKAG